MSFFSEIIDTLLLTESVPVGKINDAINRTYEVEINYHTDGKDEATGKRTIQPVAYGLTKAGNPVIRAFQPYGDTTSKTPSWKFFRIDRISSWKPNFKRIFDTPPGTFDANGNFNPDGDNTMSVVYNIATFKNTPQSKEIEAGASGGPVEKEKLKKDYYSYKDNDAIKKLNGIKKQLDNPRYISDFLKKDTNNTTNRVGTGPIVKTTPQQTTKHISYKDNDAIKKLDGIRKQLDNPTYISDYKTQQTTTGPVTKQQTATEKLTDIDKELDATINNSNSGPVTKSQQLYKAGDKVPQSVLDDWNKEQLKRRQTNG